MRLVICGNGLDLHVGFNTGYKNYREYLINDNLSHGKRSIPIIEDSDFFEERKGDCWSDLEQSLTFDGKKYIDAMIYAYDRDIHPYNEENSRAQIQASIEVQKKDPQDIAFQFTNEWFCQWLLKEYYGKEEDIKANYNGVVRNITACKDNKYITFNYTPTLETIFGVDEKDILYIHNRFPYKPKLPFSHDDFINDIIESGKKRFQFGSINNHADEWIKYLKSIRLKSQGQLIDLDKIESNLEHISWAFSKDLKSNFDKLKSFLIDVSVDEVVIIGHSFMGVDEQYYCEVIIPFYKDKKWTFYYHKNDSEAKAFVSKYSINNYELIEI